MINLNEFLVDLDLYNNDFNVSEIYSVCDYSNNELPHKVCPRQILNEFYLGFYYLFYLYIYSYFYFKFLFYLNYIHYDYYKNCKINHFYSIFYFKSYL